MRMSTRIASTIAAIGMTAALAVAAPAQASDTADLRSVPAPQTLAASTAAPTAVTTRRTCTPGLKQPAQVRSCIYLYKDGPRFAGKAVVSDVDGGRDYSVMVRDLRIQGYVGGKWQLLSNTWKGDADGWFDKRDTAKHGNWGTCYGAGETIPLRAVAKVSYKLKSGGTTTTVTRTSPSDRFRCP